LFTELALSPNSSEVHVYGWMGEESRWLLLDKLSEHVERVTGVDWAPLSNRIVTCGSVSLAATSANCSGKRICQVCWLWLLLQQHMEEDPAHPGILEKNNH